MHQTKLSCQRYAENYADSVAMFPGNEPGNFNNVFVIFAPRLDWL